MPNLAVIGAQWGDEGKGKIIDVLSDKAEIIVRFQGGHNAGHTLVIGSETIKLSLLPSGIMRPGKLAVIGNGVVLNPWALLDEIKMIEKKGVKVSPKNLVIAENVSLILPPHEELDKAREEQSKKSKIGTTGRGIGPAYEDKVGRRSLRLCDIFDKANLDERLDIFIAHHDIMRRGLGLGGINKKDLKSSLNKVGEVLEKHSAPVWSLLSEKINEGATLLFEGAQGSLLDVDYGTYPFVTSSNTMSGMASLGSGVAPSSINSVLGIVKAYTTRVGEGPFPTEIFDKVGLHLSTVGKEKGTVTGRERRCGWFDAVLVRQTGILNGFSSIALTKLDVLDGLDELKICIGYKIKGEVINFFPFDRESQNIMEPIYEKIPGWKKSTFGLRNLEDMPKNAISYIKRVEELTELPISIISTSPERDDTILIKDPYA